jgi:3-deoxy-D-manno-octulosonate 8-phosphate phosphatase (KDO 8-P phosphatase)
MAKLSLAELRERLADIRLLSLDVDGVLTDGGLYYTEDGGELRKFNVKDGMGIKLVLGAGVEVGIISASVAPAIRQRAERLGVTHVYTGVESKRAALDEMCGRLGIGLDRVAHMGDDVNDLPVFEAVGLAISVADGHAAARERAAFVTGRPGGAGCVREICDLLLEARGAD